MKSAGTIVLCCLLVSCSLVLFGCGSKADENKPVSEVKAEAEQMKAEIEKISLTAVVKVGDDGKLFGSVTSQTISELLKEKGYEFNHRKITIEEPIKELGVYEARVNIYQDVEATVKVWVVKE